jgi:hypothetical protein
MKYCKKLYVLLVLAIFLCGLSSFALLICPKCAYECKQGSEICGHCGGALPTVKKEREKEEVVEGEADGPRMKGDHLDSAIVNREVAEGRKHLKRNSLALAGLFFRNAQALEMLTDPSNGSRRSERILTMVKSCERGAKSRKVACPACRGSGRIKVEFESLSSSSSEGKASLGGFSKLESNATKECSACKGVSTVVRAGTVTDRRFSLGKARGRYGELQRARRMMPLGEGWVPQELEGTLSNKQLALFKRNLAKPCEECQGFGKSDCETCKGRGRLDCSEKGCLRGMVRVQRKGGLTKKSLSSTVKCTECRGRGDLPCEECKGRRAIACDECDGSGERSVCRKCAGQGYVACRKCKGGGEYKAAPCGNCSAEGYEVCGSCDGAGRKK